MKLKYYEKGYNKEMLRELLKTTIIILKDYKKVYEKISQIEDLDEIFDFLTQKNMHHGLCYYAECMIISSYYSYCIVSNGFKIMKKRESEYWFKTPFHENSILKVRRSILLRINRLSKLVTYYKFKIQSCKLKNQI